jgi:hypothetical protein
MIGLIDQSMVPHTQPARTTPYLIEKILKLRDDHDIGAQKIHYPLQREGIVISERGINKILKREGRTRIYRKKENTSYEKRP